MFIMKKIINGKLYDTDTAKELGFWDNGYFPNDFNYCAEWLHRKRTGEYFLYGKGGARSKYGERAGSNLWADGRTIIPMTYEEARRWAEEKLDADEYAEIFGMPDEGDDSKTVVTITISSIKEAAIRQAAEKEGISFSAYVEKYTKVKTGYWINLNENNDGHCDDDGNPYVKCSECGTCNGTEQSDYCPNCGAKMEGLKG